MPDGFGVIFGVDRANRQVGARLDQGVTRALAGPGSGFPYRGDPPPPLSVCWFTDLGSGLFIAEGPTGDARVVLNDDFLLVSTTPNFGDSPWTEPLTAGTVAQLTTEADTQGAAKLTTNATAAAGVSLRKDDLAVLPPTPPAALWLSARVMLGTTS